jgi:hypothetical protein
MSQIRDGILIGDAAAESKAQPRALPRHEQAA